MKITAVVKRSVFWVAQLVLALIVLELCARVDDLLTWQAPFRGDYSEEMLFVTDSLGYHLRPNGRFQKWHINSHGFRGPEITMEKPRGVIRVVTVGASETFGLYESPGMEYPAQLQALLEKERPGRYQVLNTAIPGISPSRIGYYFDTWLRKFSPDFVIYYPTPSFIMEAEEAPPAWKPQPTRDPGFQFKPRISGRFRDFYKRLAPQSVQTYVRQWLITRAVRNHPTDWVHSSVPPEKVAAFRKELEDLAQKVRAGGSEIIFATHANLIRSGDTEEERALLIAWRKLSPSKTESCLMETETRTNEVVTRLGVQYDIPVVDINTAIPKSSEYFADAAHFTDRGAALAAQAFLAKILKLESSRVQKNSVDSAN